MRARTPSYRLHKPSGQAVVTLNGHDVYLGKHGTPQSRESYDRILAEWLANGRRLMPAEAGADITVNELLLAYLKWAEGYYRKNGRPTSQVGLIRQAIRPLRQLYGKTLAKDFGPLALKTVRQSHIDSGVCLNEVNRRTRLVVGVFKLGVGEQLVPASVHHGLQAVQGLRRGRTDIRESEPVKPVPVEHVDAIRPHVARQVWAMIELQRLTGMRPGEVTILRTCDLYTSGTVWVYTLASHKTEHRGRERQIYLGPRAQEVLRPWLRTDPTAPLFSPRDAAEERLQGRKTPVQPSERACRVPAEAYTPEHYRDCIAAGCKRACIPTWHPSQLRHNAATVLRKEFGIEVARAVLGHSDIKTSEIYAEKDSSVARDAMEKLG